MLLENWTLKDKWFTASAPVNGVKALATIGSGTNGTVTITSSTTGTICNSMSVEVKINTGASQPLSATFVNGALTVVLGTTSSAGTADATKNTATLVAGAINAVVGKSCVAVASGDGSTALSSVVTKTNFASGTDSTNCMSKNTVVTDGTYYYICTKQGNDGSATWKRFQLATY